jgi:hypothetical protein
MSVNCVKKCLDCGEILPEWFQTAQKHGKNASEEVQPVKTRARRKTAKTAEETA